MAPNAPRVITVKIPVDKIGEVIGPKGKMINSIQDETGADITIDDDGTIYIGAVDGPSAEAARSMVNSIANPTMPEVGERYLGTVVKTTTFGAFISLLPGKDGLLHISEIKKMVGKPRIDSVDDVLSVGQKVRVEIKEVDDRGKLSLTAAKDEDEAAAGRRRPSQPTPEPRPTDVSTRTLHRGQDGSVVKRTVLPGGLRVVTESVPTMRSVSFGVWVGVGSRDESGKQAGASHYLEHLLFKGTRQRSALEISSAIDRLGGEMNAFTAKEFTCFYARVLDADLPVAVDVVTDMVLVVDDHRPGLRVRARCDPRRDRHARRRPRRRRPRHLRADRLR